jgi:AmiR/NasT family two-component response regulator
MSAPKLMPENHMDAVNETDTDPRHEQLSAKLAEVTETVDQLTVAVRSNRDIGAATGMVMVPRRLTQQEAFDLLRRTSGI